MIRYAELIRESIVDGLGLRVAVFLQGCPRHCPGCHNPKLLPQEGGIEITEEELANLILQSLSPIHRGVTFTGGDPLLQHGSLHKIISIIKKKDKHINVWVYTGYVFEEINSLSIMSLIDVLVDGPFILAQRDLGLPFRGSSNQRIIDVAKSLQSGTVELVDLDKV